MIIIVETKTIKSTYLHNYRFKVILIIPKPSKTWAKRGGFP